MRVAVLADIHGNLAAFEAALEHVARQRVDYTLLAGDLLVGSPDSAACWQLARLAGYPLVRGNHEGYIAQYGSPTAPALWHTRQYAPVHWAAEQFSAAERQQIDALPRFLRFPEIPDLLMVHASLRNDRDSIMAYTPESDLAQMFPDVSEALIVRAHNHMAQMRLWGPHTIVTAGSVGLPLDANTSAQYLLLDRTRTGWHIQHQSVAYDLSATIRRFHTSGYLEQAGPIAELYLREVATASFYIVPFLRAYTRWNQQEPISLEAGVARFLAQV